MTFEDGTLVFESYSSQANGTPDVPETLASLPSKPMELFMACDSECGVLVRGRFAVHPPLLSSRATDHTARPTPNTTR